MTEISRCTVSFSDEQFCIVDSGSSDDIDNQTPTAPRGKRSDISENDRELFLDSYKDLLDMLDRLENQTSTDNDAGLAMLDTVSNA